MANPVMLLGKARREPTGDCQCTKQTELAPEKSVDLATNWHWMDVSFS